jgi:hypothetical protein
MLPGERYSLTNTQFNKKFSKAMEVSKKLLKASNVLGRDGISTNNVAAVDKSRETLDDISRNMAADCRKVDL